MSLHDQQVVMDWAQEQCTQINAYLSKIIYNSFLNTGKPYVDTLNELLFDIRHN